MCEIGIKKIHIRIKMQQNNFCDFDIEFLANFFCVIDIFSYRIYSYNCTPPNEFYLMSALYLFKRVYVKKRDNFAIFRINTVNV